jgi:hypothetical protein
MHDHSNTTTAGAGVSLPFSRRRRRSRSHARTLFSNSVCTTGAAALLRHQRSDGYGREAELQEVIATIEARLAGIDDIRTREHDDKLDAIEALAAPYAFAFVYEIRRLERLLRRRFASTVRGAQRTLGCAIRRRRLTGGGEA